jgi:hypothetical protein
MFGKKINIILLILIFLLVKEVKSNCHYSCSNCTSQAYISCFKCTDTSDKLTILEDPAKIVDKSFLHSIYPSGACTAITP